MTDSVSYHLLSTCPVDDAVGAWNDGFAGYFSDMTTTPDVFERRMRQDGIVAEASILAYAGDRPVGIALNAIADVHGIRQAWNGGTAVAEDFRGKGVARELLRRSIELYAEHRVGLATLEARSENARAIALYLKFGYRRNGELYGLAAHRPRLDAFGDGAEVEFVAPERLTSVPFYQKNAQWSTLWPNARGATAIIVAQRGAPFAYVLFRRSQDKKSGEPVIRILQAACADDGPALRAALGALFAHHRDVSDYLAYNIPGSNRRGLEVLREAGFEAVWDQVWMIREFLTAR
ncbi:MAG TPA: GNAT family N-acetyltransferase [Candidatus Eremiobacteraceae bacterium]